MSAQFTISGFPALYEDFKKLDWSKRRPVMRKALKQAAEPIRQRAGELAPVLTGTLSRNIIVSGAGLKNDANVVSVLIGPSTKAFWGLFQEAGYGPGDPQPFLDPAFRQEEDRAIESMADILSDEIQKSMRGGKR
jgi:HK97 gp10 family phage protein